MIGITACERNFDLYLKWLEHFGIEYITLDYRDKDAYTKFDKVKGLILSGGIDIYPELYNDWENKEDTGKYDTDRDGFEFKLTEGAVARGIPLLGICRGCQFINVYFNGSLIYDIPSIRKVDHSKINGEMRKHDINVFENSLLHECTGVSRGTVNSSHHQSVDRLGEGLKATAKAPDGIIEAIEYRDNSGKPFMMGIQWHPERFENFDDVFSKNIIMKFNSGIK